MVSLFTVVVFHRYKISFNAEKILKFIYFRRRDDHSEDIFVSNKPLMVYEFNAYELLKFVLKSIRNVQSEEHLNKLFEYENTCTKTRNTKTSTLNSHPLKNSITRRGYSITPS